MSVNRADVILAAVAAREHALLIGPPGFGKTKFAFAVLQAAFGQDFRALSLAPNTPPEVVSGGVDVAYYMKTGHIRITKEGTPNDSSISAWLFDEISRANEALLDALLPALDPPTGRHAVAIATANWQPKGKRFEALASRFALWVRWRPNTAAKALLAAFEMHASETGAADPLVAKVVQAVGPQAQVARALFNSGPTAEEAAALKAAFLPMLEALLTQVVAEDDERVIATLGLGKDNASQAQQALELLRGRITPRLMRQWARLATHAGAYFARTNGGNPQAAAYKTWEMLAETSIPTPDPLMASIVADLMMLPVGGGQRAKAQALLTPVWRLILEAADQGNGDLPLDTVQRVVDALKKVTKDAQAVGLAETDDFKGEVKSVKTVLGQAMRGNKGWQALVPDWAREATGLPLVQPVEGQE